MGVVYLARHLALDRVVALKLTRGGADASDESLERFRVEAQAVAQLQHPNIIQIFEVNEHDGSPYCALEFVAGGNLAHKIHGKSQPPAEAAALLETLARAIHHAHQKRIVHRDLKPANILMDVDGAPKITDFGLAKRIEDFDAGLTRTGAVMGTPAYMAPEQAAGDLQQIGPHTDVYALGVILFELLTGALPFKDKSAAAVIHMVQHADVPPPSRSVAGIPRDLETICLKCLAKEPGQRYSSALALAQDIERFRAGEPIIARREGVLRKTWRLVRKRGLVAVFLLTILLAVGISATVALRASRIRQASALSREFDIQLKANEWPADHADRLEGLVEQIGEFDGPAAEESRRRLMDQAAKRVGNVLARPRVGAADMPELEQTIAWIAQREPSLGTRLRAEVVARIREWQVVREFSAPFPALPPIFSPAEVQVETTGLRRLRANPPIHPTSLPSRAIHP